MPYRDRQPPLDQEELRLVRLLLDGFTPADIKLLAVLVREHEQSKWLKNKIRSVGGWAAWLTAIAVALPVVKRWVLLWLGQ